MNIDMLKLYRDHGVRFDIKGNNCAPGWIQVRCPHCDDKSNHLGWNLKECYFSCWKCGRHNVDVTLAKILRIDEHTAWMLAQRYLLRPSSMNDALDDKEEIIRPDKVIVPGFSLDYEVECKIHRRYLSKRGYDPDELFDLWELKGMGIVGAFAFRVIYPIYHNGEIVSFQGRDVTGRAEKRWKTCPQELERRDHKHCLGGSQLATGDSCAIVEGATDGWRLGPGAVWTFGTSYLLEQVALIKNYKRRFIILDSEDKDPNAMIAGERLANMLSAFGGETVIVELDSGDPGDLPQEEANYLMTKEWRIR